MYHIVQIIGGDGEIADFVAGEKVKTWISLIKSKHSRNPQYFPFEYGKYIPDLVGAILEESGVEIPVVDESPPDYVVFPCVADAGIFAEIDRLVDIAIAAEIYYEKEKAFTGLSVGAESKRVF